MGLLTDLRAVLTSKKPKAAGARVASILEVETALQRLREGRESAAQTIRTITGKRAELLLADAPQSDFAALEAEADAAALEMEKLDLAEPMLVERLQALRDAARRALFADLRRQYDTAALEYAAACRAALEKLEGIRKISTDADAASFASEAKHCFVVPPNMLVSDLLDRYEAEIERVREMTIEPATAAPKKAAAKLDPTARPGSHFAPGEAPRRVSLLGPVPQSQRPSVASISPPKSGPMRRSTRPLRRDTAAGEEVLIQFVRSGAELPGGDVALAGDVIAVDKATADKLMRSGAADVLPDSGGQ